MYSSSMFIVLGLLQGKFIQLYYINNPIYLERTSLIIIFILRVQWTILYTLHPSISPIGLSTYHMYVDELDTPITMSEVETAIHHLKPDEAAGDDNIRNELILYGRESFKSYILVLLTNFMTLASTQKYGLLE